MAYASFNGHDQKDRPVNNRVNEAGFNQTKALAKVYGYMGLGILITAVVCFFASWFFSSHINEVIDAGKSLTPWAIALISTWAVSGLICLILAFVIPVKAAFGKGSLWFPYILFTVCMGLLLTVILLSGIKFYIVGEAFGITTLLFAGMAVIGWTTKKNLAPVAFIAMALLWAILLIALIGFITFALNGWSATQAFWFDLGIQAAVIVVLLLITMVDTWRIKIILANAGECENMYLYGAFVMYSDFISILIRVILILARTRR